MRLTSKSAPGYMSKNKIQRITINEILKKIGFKLFSKNWHGGWISETVRETALRCSIS